MHTLYNCAEFRSSLQRQRAISIIMRSLDRVPGRDSAVHRRARAPGSVAGLLRIAAFGCAIAVSGCASLPHAAEPADPLEPLNRVVFDVNTAVDRALIEPAARAWRAAVPAFPVSYTHLRAHETDSY